MANVQLHKTVNAGTITKTAMDQKQSLEVVQTMLHGGLSTISYMRSFFPDKAFDRQIYEMSDQILPYEDYADGKGTKGKSEISEPKTVMQVLRRNRSKRVDLFLDWLETGAFAALKAGNLRSLQIYVHADPTSRDKVIETYTFNIKYVPQLEGGDQVLAGLELDSPNSTHVSVEATNGALQILIRQVIDACNSLPDLPDKRYISMALFYVQETQMQDKPKGFIPNMLESLLFAEAEGWERRVQQIQDLPTGFHGASLKISYLQQQSFQVCKGFVGLPPPRFPQAIQYNARFSLQEEMNVNEPAQARIEEFSDSAVEESRLTTTSSSVVHNVVRAQEIAAPSRDSKRPNQSIITPAPTSDAAGQKPDRQHKHVDEQNQYFPTSKALTLARASQDDGALNTQSSNVPEMKGALSAMMQPEHITQGDTQTQWFPPPPRSESTETQPLSDLSPSKDTDTASPTRGTRPALSQSIAKMLEKAKPTLRATAHQLATTQNTKAKTTDIILCQCGHAKDEGDMVNCTFCGTWQHLHCYGYASARDPRLPVEHVCYQCLLGGSEDQTLKTLGELALRRRGMHFALQHGLKSQREFIADMGLSTAIAGPIYQYLKKEGYVVAASGSHRAGFASSGKPQFVPVKDGPKHQLMLERLFDPQMLISHHYELPPNLMTHPTSFTQQLLATQIGNMPPPATPASHLKKNAGKTPGSGLDLRASMTPFETPSRPRRQQLQTQKRPRNDDENAGPPPKRRTVTDSAKRLSSVRTELILDAGGLPSSPTASVVG